MERLVNTDNCGMQIIVYSISVTITYLHALEVNLAHVWATF